MPLMRIEPNMINATASWAFANVTSNNSTANTQYSNEFIVVTPGGNYSLTSNAFQALVNTINQLSLAGNNTTLLEKQYNQPGTLLTGDTGTRWYPASNVIIRNVVARVIQAPVGANIILSVNKNGVSQQTITIPENQTSSALTNTSISVARGEYITIGLNQVGTTTKGSNLTTTVSYLRSESVV